MKFITKENKAFVEELKREVTVFFEKHNISTYGNEKIYFKTAVMATIYILPFILILSGTISSFGGIILSWLISGLGMAGIGLNLMHDSNHHSVSNKQKINSWLAKSMYFIGGTPSLWQFQHNVLHHRFTNIHGLDGDISPVPLLRLSPHQPYMKIHKYQHLYAWIIYSFITLSFATAKDFVKTFQFMKAGETVSREKTYTRLFIDMAIAKTMYYLVILGLPLSLTAIPWHWIIAGFIVMHLSSGLLLSVIFQTAHVLPSTQYPLPNHNLEIDNNWVIHQLYTTCNFSPKSKIFTWAIGGLNHQVEHHIFPNISHIHYRDISKIVKQTARKHQLPYHVNKNFFNAIRQHYKMLRTLGEGKSIK